MSHWFHRNVLKATTLVGYHDLLGGSFNLTKLASDLKRCRERLLDLLPDSSHNLDAVNAVFINFLSFMSGFFLDYKVSGKKVRYALPFKWTQTLLGQVPHVEEDVAFDVANMSINVALWHMKHASYIAAKKTVSMDDAKEIHTSLRRAAGIFQMVQKEIIPLLQPGSVGSDIDPRVLGAFMHQCVAEAQEVTVARAIEMQHNDNLISALSNETSKMFDNAQSSLGRLSHDIAEQWSFYLQIKKNIYLAYAYCYSGRHLLSEDHCGEAIRAFKESQVYYQKALNLCKSYAKVKGPSKPVKPDGHKFFTGINATVTDLLERCERENGFIYHQKIPDMPPELEIKATYGLASPEAFSLPPPAPLWEAAFEQTGSFPTISDSILKVRSKRREKELTPVREIRHYEPSDSPIDDHGCVLQ